MDQEECSHTEAGYFEGCDLDKNGRLCSPVLVLRGTFVRMRAAAFRRGLMLDTGDAVDIIISPHF